MLRHPVMAALAAAALLASSCVWANAEHRLVEKYDRWAGSEKNARELVEGLRNDTRIDLSKNGKTTSFTPATGKMGWGNVDHALALAKASLAEEGIRNPTPEQIKAALNGGTITTKSGQRVTMPGVLKLRASGMGWGQIAHKLGFKLGDLKHADKHHGHKHAHKHDGKHEHADWKHHGKPEFQRTSFERPHKPEKVERPEKFERPQRPERPEKPHPGR
jgi:hypothetical protein